jgi:hypothetical protein
MKENLKELSAERCLCKATGVAPRNLKKDSSAAFGESQNALQTCLRG